MSMKRRILKKKSHRILWRICTIIFIIFTIIFFFGAYVFYTNNTDYSDRNFGAQEVTKILVNN